MRVQIPIVSDPNRDVSPEDVEAMCAFMEIMMWCGIIKMAYDDITDAGFYYIPLIK